MGEIYMPKKGFEDLFAALLEEYKREIQAIAKSITKRNQRSDEKLTDWINRKTAETEASLVALAAKYKPSFRALSDAVTEIPKK